MKEKRQVIDLLRRAFEKASELPVDEQEALAALIISAIESGDEQWDQAIARDPNKLKRLIEEARDDARAGRIEPLDIGKL